MKRLTIIPLCALLALSVSCNNQDKEKDSNADKKAADISPDNPFLKESTLEFQTADFSKIKNSDFLPAFNEGIRQKMEEIKAIVQVKDSATFENTLVALETSGRMLARVQGVFYLLAGANTNDSIQEIEQEVAPKLASLSDAVFLNDTLFSRVKSIYNQREHLDLDAESKRLVEYYYQQFIMAGAELSGDNKESMKKLNQEEASLMTTFSNKLIAAAKAGAYVTEDKKDLEGLSESELATAQRSANDADQKGKYLIPLSNTTQQSIFTDLDNRATRQQIYKNSWDRAERGDDNDTRKSIVRIAEIRAQKAKLLGFESYAAWNLQDQMAKTPQAVQDLFDKLAPAAVESAKREGEELQELITKSGKDFKLEASDWNYYSEKLRKLKYDLDEDAIKPYFVLDSVLKNGVFYAANQLYGLTFKERTDLPVYQEDVRVFEVHDNDGSVIGLFYSDFFKRDNKSGGAWMSNIVEQSKLLGTKPVIYNVCNFTKPAKGEPALLAFDDVITMFHEFGHALHGFFANQMYPSISGTATPRDFVEFPSQFNEHWAIDPVIFKNYAIHYETGKPMPQALVDKIKKASTFNQGYMLTELLAAAALDMQWHTISPDQKIDDVGSFEKQALEKSRLYLETVPPRYRSTFFLHIWGNGYSAGYYAYLWTEMLDDDAFNWFENNGGMTRENGQRFRDEILSIGNTKDLAKAYRDFVGHDPRIEPMLKNRGISK